MYHLYEKALHTTETGCGLDNPNSEMPLVAFKNFFFKSWYKFGKGA